MIIVICLMICVTVLLVSWMFVDCLKYRFCHNELISINRQLESLEFNQSNLFDYCEENKKHINYLLEWREKE